MNISKNYFSIILLILIGILFSSFYLKSTSRWWFEDDPMQIHDVAQVKNIFDIFLDPAINAGFGNGKVIVQMQILSYWIDVHFFGANPTVMYFHGLISLIVVMVLMYAVMLGWTQNKTVSFGSAVLWMILPSTIATHQYISTRHYIEGFLFTLLTCLLVRKFKRSKENRTGWLFLIVLSSITALLFKEVSAALTITFLMLSGLNKRDFVLSITAFILAILYAALRLSLIGSDVYYTMPFLGMRDYLEYLAIFPFTFSASKAGYVFYFSFGLATAVYIKTCRREAIKASMSLFLMLISVLVTLYPVAYAVLQNYKMPGTWYRVPFIVNSLLIMWICFVLSRICSNKVLVGTLILTSLLILPGTYHTRQHWKNLLARAEAEGKFYLDNPDKLILSEEEAYWFIPGIHEMYAVPKRHYINKQQLTGKNVKALLEKYSTIWRYHERQFIQDDVLYSQLKKDNEMESLDTISEMSLSLSSSDIIK